MRGFESDKQLECFKKDEEVSLRVRARSHAGDRQGNRLLRLKIEIPKRRVGIDEADRDGWKEFSCVSLPLSIERLVHVLVFRPSPGCSEGAIDDLKDRVL